jgi:hypothetical protein
VVNEGRCSHLSALGSARSKQRQFVAKVPDAFAAFRAEIIDRGFVPVGHVS